MLGLELTEKLPFKVFHYFMCNKKFEILTLFVFFKFRNYFCMESYVMLKEKKCQKVLEMLFLQKML